MERLDLIVINNLRYSVVDPWMWMQGLPQATDLSMIQTIQAGIIWLSSHRRSLIFCGTFATSIEMLQLLLFCYTQQIHNFSMHVESIDAMWKLETMYADTNLFVNTTQWSKLAKDGIPAGPKGTYFETATCWKCNWLLATAGTALHSDIFGQKGTTHAQTTSWTRGEYSSWILVVKIATGQAG